MFSQRSDVLEAARGIAESLQSLRPADAVEHAEKQVRHRQVVVFCVASGFQRSARVARENHRKVCVRVAIAVGIAAAVNNLRIVQVHNSVT